MRTRMRIATLRAAVGALALLAATTIGCVGEEGDPESVGVIELDITGTSSSDVGYFRFQADVPATNTTLYTRYLDVSRPNGVPTLSRTFALPARVTVRFTMGFTDINQQPIGEQVELNMVFSNGERFVFSHEFNTNPGAGTIGIYATANSSPVVDEVDLPLNGSVTSTTCITINAIEDFDDTDIYPAFVTYQSGLSWSPPPNDGTFVRHPSTPATQCMAFLTSATRTVHACACDPSWCDCLSILCNPSPSPDPITGTPANSCEIDDNRVVVKGENLDAAAGNDVDVVQIVPGPGVTFRWDGDGNNATGLEATLSFPDHKVVTQPIAPQTIGNNTFYAVRIQNPDTGEERRVGFQGNRTTGVITNTFNEVVVPGST